MLPSYPYLILSLYPSLTQQDFFNGSILLQDEGSGPYIAAWNVPGLSEPTEQELYSQENQLYAAKMEGQVVITSQSTAASNEVLVGLNYDVYVSQASIPEVARLPQYQSALEANNTIAIDLANRQSALNSATTVEEVNAIVYPPQGESH